MNTNIPNKNDRILEGICAYEKNLLDNAEKIFIDLSKDYKTDVEINYHLGIIYQKKDLIQQSLHYFLKAYSYNPKKILALISLAKIYISLGNYKEALNFTNQILEIDVNHSEAVLLKATALLELKDINNSTTYLKKWLLQNPSKKKVLLHLCMLHYKKHNIEEACSICKTILSVFPNDVETTFCYCIIQLKPIYCSKEEIESVRLSYQITLERLAYLAENEPKETLKEAVEIIGYLQSFLLAYQGENDKLLQATYGKIVTKILSCTYPEIKRNDLSINKTNRPIRLGFVSRYFKMHSNWKTRLRGWIKEINKNDFHIFAYCTSETKSDEIEEILPFVSKFTMGLNSLEDYAKAIIEDELDIMIYQEIGMDQLTMQLASFKLAPIQCASWGHPQTSGLPSIDYFLSSKLMEPQNADHYYTEKLVKLPNLSIYYEPISIKLLNKSRKDFSLPPDAILYWCCQNNSKFLPQYDDIFVEIKKAVPLAKFVFINQLHTANQTFKERLKKTFNSANLNLDDCCIFLPMLTIQEFATVTSLMDIFLDSIGWSGCNTTLESINYNLPIVTFPLESMRSRHTAAILTMMGMQDEISNSLDDYIKKASSLGLSENARKKFRQKIAKNKSRLYRDQEAILGLEHFLKSLF